MKTEKYQKEGIAEVWDYVSLNYDQESYWNGLENHANLIELLSYIGDPANKRIIEVGSGSGFLSMALARKGARVALLDISEVALEAAGNAFKEAGLPEPEIICADALSSGLPDDKYDIVWNGGVIEHFFDEGKEKLILEMFRMTKPGGSVIIMVPNSWCVQAQVVQLWQKFRKTWIYGYEDDMSPKRLAKMCKRLGIKDFEVSAFNPVVGWKLVPKYGKILKLLGLEKLDYHLRHSWMGFVSVLVIKK